MLSPLIIVIISALSVGLFSTFLLALAVSTASWQTITWDDTSLALYRANASQEKIRVQPAACSRCYTVEVQGSTEKNGENATWTYDRHIFNSYSGVWFQCDQLTDPVRELITDMSQCYVFVFEYDEETSHFTKKGKWVARMHNSAGSCFIVSLIDMAAAFIVGSIGIVHRQVSMCMITGVLYILAALFGVFGIVIYLTKHLHEVHQCYTIYGLTDLPDELCSARVVQLSWSHYVAWVSIFFATLACVIWLFLSRVLRVIKSKTML